MDIKISVVIPTCQRPELLTRCLKALKKQRFEKKHFEVIVVSDGRDDVTYRCLKSLIKSQYLNIKHISTPEKKGPAAARNIGWLESKGRLIAFTDDDCIPDVNWLEDIEKAHTGVEEIVYTGNVKVTIPQKPTDYQLSVGNLEKAEFATANCVCTKKALIKVGGFDERFQLAWREDADLHFKIIEHNIPIQKIEATVVYPVSESPWGISIMEQKNGVFNALLYKKYPQLYREKVRSYISWFYYIMVIAAISIIVGLLTHAEELAVGGSVVWFLFLAGFITKRLSSTSHSLVHITEIIVTSTVIPFLSVYWQIYGALKYRVLFI